MTKSDTNTNDVPEVAPVPVIGDMIDLGNVAAVQAGYDQLIGQPWEADDTDIIAEWVKAWSDWERRVEEAATFVWHEKHRVTNDKDRAAAYNQYARVIYPIQLEARDVLNRRLLRSGWSEPDLEQVLRGMQAEVDIFRPNNVPLLAQEAELGPKRGQIVGALKVEFDGEMRTVAGLKPYLESTDRAVREAAWKEAAGLFDGVRRELDELYDKLFKLRLQLGKNADMTYPRFRWYELNRFSYHIEDVDQFVRSVLDAVVPVAARRAEVRRAALGVDEGDLRPWDTTVNIHGGDSRMPFKTEGELVTAIQQAHAALHPLLGDWVQVMIDGNTMDMMNRSDKEGGAYCTHFPETNRSALLANATGVPRDLIDGLHEAGHGAHFKAGGSLPYYWQLMPGIEACELAATALEAVGSAYMDDEHGGPLTRQETLRLRIKFFDNLLAYFPHIACVTALQHWAFDNPEHTADERHAEWDKLQAAFKPYINWDGATWVWHQQLHPFSVPLYYPEYAVAYIGAVQFFRTWEEDPVAAMERYMKFIGAGNTRSLADLFKMAGCELAFDRDTMEGIALFVEKKLGELEAELAAAQVEGEPPAGDVPIMYDSQRVERASRPPN